MPLSRIDHILLNVRNRERSEKFFTEILGFEVRRHLPGGIGVFLTCGTSDHDLVLMQVDETNDEAEAAGPLGSRRLGLGHAMFRAETLEDVQAVYRRLKAGGTEEIQPVDHGHVRSIYFADPDGNSIEIGYEVPVDQRLGEHILEMQAWDVEEVKPSQ